MSETLTKFLQAFIPLFVAIDPVGLAAVFLGLGQGVAPAVRHRIAWQATVTGGVVALGFLFLGQNVFAAVGVSVKDFQIAGGLILFILAARDLIQAEGAPMKLPDDFGIVPLGMPLIAGPAMITTLLLLVQTQGMAVTLVALTQLSSPAVFGLRRVSLLLPETGLDQLTDQELRLMFLHEMAHVRRQDMLLNFLLMAVQFVHWFNPLLWLGLHRLRAVFLCLS